MSVRYYKWGYTWEELKKFYMLKSKEDTDRTNAFCQFLVELTSAALGGKKDEQEVGLDDGNLDDLDETQIENLKIMLGEKDFANLYPDYV